MPLLGLAGLRELIRRRRPPPPAVQPFYSNFDWLEGLASWPATNLLLYVLTVYLECIRGI
jgi:formate hydrogenlyase subunit 4